MTKLDKLQNYLKSGATATPKQITGMFGLKNPTAAIYALRERGVCVYANKATLKDGTTTTKYVIGGPSKKMVRVAHALGLFA